MKGHLNRLLLFLFASFLFYGCLKSNTHADILILYTNDEHGHLEERSKGWNKAVNLTECWENEKKNCKECAVFIVSGGDNFTGSAISTVVHGESVARVMNTIGYDVSAVGNHEFDYGINVWKKNRQISSVTYLAANLAMKKGTPPFTSSVKLSRKGVLLNFIGLTTEKLMKVTVSHIINQFTLHESEQSALNALKNIDSKLPLIFVTHQSFETSKAWIKKIAKKPLIVFNGHNHEHYVKKAGGVTYLQTGKFLERYGKALFRWKKDGYHLVSAKLVDIPKKMSISSQKAKKVKSLLDKYRKIIKEKAGDALISVTEAVSKESFMKVHTCGLLEHYPEADIVISNPGGYRDSIAPGVFREYNLISVLPFENRVVMSRIKGKYLAHNFVLAEDALCGAEKKGKQWFIADKKLNDETFYTVVIQDFILEGGDGFEFMQPTTENKILADGWRDPIKTYLIKKATKGFTLNQLIP